MSPLRLPRYDEACLTHLLPDATAAVLGREPGVVPIPEGSRAVIVLVIDGLGQRLLSRHADVAPFLSAAAGTTLDAVFPATTATNLTSLATGVTPREHGIAATVLGIGGRRFVTLSWSWERLFDGPDARDEVPPERQQPLPTLFERMRTEGVRPVTLFAPEHIGSGLTRASLRGGDEVPVIGLDTTLRTAIDEATASTAPTVVYCHHASVDTAGHLDGPGSAAWCEELAAADRTIAHIAADLPPGVALVVTADHGAVDVRSGLIDVVEHPELLDGVEVFAGDARAPHLHVADGAQDDVLATWRDVCGDLAEVRSRAEAIAEGWFGPGSAPGAAAPSRGAGLAAAGDIIVAARAPVAWIHRDNDERGGRMPGHHGSLTADELEIPALVITR